MTLAVLPWETEGKLDFSEINQKATGKGKIVPWGGRWRDMKETRVISASLDNGWSLKKAVVLGVFRMIR